MEWMILPYQRYFDFEGRSRRKEYWMFTLLQVLVVLVLVGLLFASRPPESGEPPDLFMALVVIYALANFIPSLAVQVRRFHDQIRSGWMVLLGFIPYIGGFIVLVFMLIDGTPGPNEYGDDPKQRGVNPDVFS